ncbi:MAG TPA: hypothetical protein VK209_00645 [Candidatus Sulfotelmatobacter sp.]|nr:hypothetical protein [Candidatus Sulfotelmatobacter sp.]
MNRKSTGLILLLVISVAAIVAGIVLTVQAQNPQLLAESDQQLTTVTTVSQPNNDGTAPTGANFTDPFFGMGPRGGMRGRGPCGFGRGAIEVSSDYVANVTSIAKADTDVQQLLSNGYNISRVIPQTRMTIDANGNVAMKASKATLILENGTTGRAFVTLDLQQGKVTKIVTFTVTVINKP